MVKTREKTSFLSSMIKKYRFFMMQLPKKVRLAKFQPFLKASVFSTVGATLTKQIILRLQHLKKKVKSMHCCKCMMQAFSTKYYERLSKILTVFLSIICKSRFFIKKPTLFLFVPLHCLHTQFTQFFNMKIK